MARRLKATATGSPPHSILYKTRLPFLLVFNKTDVQPHDFALDWMRDFEAFQDALLARRQTHGEEDGPAYMDSLMNSMSLVLDEFYKHLRVSTWAPSPGARLSWLSEFELTRNGALPLLAST